jgi:hypothetical protein
MKHWDMSHISIKLCLQRKELHRNHTASCDYRYTGSSGKQEVTIEIYWILKKLL